MILAILSALASLFWLTKIRKKAPDRMAGSWKATLVFLPIFAGLMGFVVSSCVYCTLNPKVAEKEWEEMEIVPLQNIDKKKMYFVAFYESRVDDYYHFSSKNVWRRSKLHGVIASAPVTFHENTNEPQLRIYEEKYIHTVSLWAGFNTNGFRKAKYEFHIPEGSLKKPS